MNAVRHVNAGVMSCRASSLPTLLGRWTPMPVLVLAVGVVGGRVVVALVLLRRSGNAVERAPLARRAAADRRTRCGRELAAVRAERPASADLALASMEDGVLLFGPGRRDAASPTRPSKAQLGRPARLRQALLPPRPSAASTERAAADARPSRRSRSRPAPRPERSGGFAAPRQDGSVVLVIRDITGDPAARIRCGRDFVANAVARAEDARRPRSRPRPRRSGRPPPRTLGDPRTSPPSSSARPRGCLAHRLGPARPVPARVRAACWSETVRARGDRPRRGRAVRGAGRRGGRRALGHGRAAVPRVRGSAPGPWRCWCATWWTTRSATRPRVARCRSSSRRDDGEVVLAIADTGLGIPNRDLPRIFETLLPGRPRRSSPRPEGTGLGLSIVRHVAENHGGRVDRDERARAGTRFEVRLPASP